MPQAGLCARLRILPDTIHQIVRVMVARPSEISTNNHNIGCRYRQFPTQALRCEIQGNFSVERFRDEALEHNVAEARARWRRHERATAFSPAYQERVAPCRDLQTPKKS